MRRNSLLLGIGICLGLLTGLVPRSASGWEENKLFNLRYLYLPRADFKEEAGEIGMEMVGAAGNIPFSLNDSTILIGGLAYSGLFLDYRGLVFDPGEGFSKKDLAKDLHVLDLILGANVDWDDNWSTLLLLYPGIHSDFQDLNGKDIYFSGAALAGYQVSESLSLSAGIYYDDSFGHPQLLPLLGVQWRINESLSLEAFIPQFLVFTWQLDSWLAVGLKGSVEGNQYRLKEGTPWEHTVVENSQILAGPFVDLQLAGELFLRLQGGFVFGRTFEFRDDDSNAKLFDGDIEDTGYAGLSLSYRY